MPFRDHKTKTAPPQALIFNWLYHRARGRMICHCRDCEQCKLWQHII